MIVHMPCRAEKIACGECLRWLCFYGCLRRIIPLSACSRLYTFLNYMVLNGSQQFFRYWYTVTAGLPSESALTEIGK